MSVGKQTTLKYNPANCYASQISILFLLLVGADKKRNGYFGIGTKFGNTDNDGWFQSGQIILESWLNQQKKESS